MNCRKLIRHVGSDLEWNRFRVGWFWRKNKHTINNKQLSYITCNNSSWIGSTTVFAYLHIAYFWGVFLFPLSCSSWRTFTALILHVCSSCTFISRKNSNTSKWQLQTFLAILSSISVLDIILTMTLVSFYQGSTCRFNNRFSAKLNLHTVHKVMT